MLGNHFTKPLKGALFKNFRAEIMNIPYDLNMYDLGIDGAGMKKWVMWKLNNNTDPECP